MEQKPRFVVVDDDLTLLDVLSKLLAMEGHDCEIFASAEAALAHLTQRPCDILITDIVMPGMKGLGLTRQVKQRWPETTVIVMTGFIEDFSFDDAIEAGASDFIKKPFSPHEMMLRIKHVLLQGKMRELAITDELTGLLNRRGFFTMSTHQLKVTLRSRGKLVLLFADMDGLKSINDRLGHLRGDEALVALADIFRKTFRESDILARISGDEFAMLLPDTMEQNLGTVFSRLQSHLDDHNTRPGSAYKLSVSTGIAVYAGDAPRSIEELLKTADAMMYQDKQRKRAANMQV